VHPPPALHGVVPPTPPPCHPQPDLMTGSSDVETLLKARLVRSRGFSWRVVSLSYTLRGRTDTDTDTQQYWVLWI
jgi:hypothetical protein